MTLTIYDLYPSYAFLYHLGLGFGLRDGVGWDNFCGLRSAVLMYLGFGFRDGFGMAFDGIIRGYSAQPFYIWGLRVGLRNGVR